MTFSEQYRAELLKAIETIDLTKVDRAIEWFKESRDTGRHIFVCGNGGSASTASHFACYIVKGCSFNRASRIRIMALTDQLPTITAYANDVGYDVIFAEQLKNFAQRGICSWRSAVRAIRPTSCWPWITPIQSAAAPSP